MGSGDEAKGSRRWLEDEAWVQNNNGNYSRRVVPIQRLQPRLFAESDYCYSDRLRGEILDLILQPMAFGFCLLQQNLMAVLSPAFAGFRD